MSPILSTALATERHADLLRAAELRRRTAIARTHRRSPWARLAGTAEDLVGRLRGRVATTPEPTTTLCCA